MSRKGNREAKEPGISKDATGWSVRVSIGSGASRVTREQRYPPKEELPYLRAQRAFMESELRKELEEVDPDIEAERGTFAGDVRTYLGRVAGRLEKATLRSRQSELKAWTAVFHKRQRRSLRRGDAEDAINAWRRAEQPPSAKTILNRVRTLKHLYRILDGKRARTPVDDLDLPTPPRRRPRDVAVKTIRTVIARLVRQERNGRLRDAKTRARFLVRITTGQRPVQIMKTTRADWNRELRVWHVPAAKGGDSVPLYLNDDMMIAFELFDAADAYGPFDTTSQARVLRRNGWPADVPVYNARHAVGIAFSEGGEDLSDIQAWMGHRHIQTTRDFYVPRLFSRMKAMSERADKRVNLSPRWARFVGTPQKPKGQRQMPARPDPS